MKTNLKIDFVAIGCSYRKDGEWTEISLVEHGDRIEASIEGIRVLLKPAGYGWDYEIEARTNFETQVRLAVSMPADKELFHVIPCTIYGDNNLERVKPGELPCLTKEHPGTRLCAPFWELRADRAAVPVSMMSDGERTAGISIDPYSEVGEGWIHNGVFASLPGRAGVSLGYVNLPSTFVDKGNAGAITEESVREARAKGRIYLMKEGGRQRMHEIVQKEYGIRHSRAVYKRTFREAAQAIVNACVGMNWNEQWQAYTDMSCCPPEKTELKAWRPVYEIGWTGIAELACPFIMAEKLLGLGKETFGKAKDGFGLFDQVAGAYNEASGLLNDLVAPIDESGSLTDGWWVWYYIGKGQHCAYTNGKAVYGMLKAVSFLEKRGESWPREWLAVCLNVLDTISALQREDGNYGYTYSATQKKVIDWDGFAGCWFVPAMVYAYRLAGKESYLASARKAESFYREYVKALNCYSTPMDTWKAVDEEGNLAFVRGCRLLHETTGEEQFLEDLRMGACYEYLWRYGYAARPENPPLKDGWNSCGGSVTSVSNPHIHPMGVLIDTDLRYLADKTGEEYHRMRAMDGTAWLMQNLELYPEKSGYGCYGMMSERFCPSDGLVTERYSDGRPYSSWFTFNLWATANVLEAIMDLIAEGQE